LQIFRAASDGMLLLNLAVWLEAAVRLGALFDQAI
jgi:hypothetical protein